MSSNEHTNCVNCICFEIKKFVSFFGVVIRDSLFSPSHRTRSARNYKVISLVLSFFFHFGWRHFSILHGVEFANFSSSIRFRAIKCRNLHKNLRKRFQFLRPRKDILRKRRTILLIT